MNVTQTSTTCEKVLDLMLLNRDARGELMRDNLPKWIREELGYAPTSPVAQEALALLIAEDVVRLDFRYTDSGVRACYTIDEDAAQAIDFESILRHKGSERYIKIRFALSDGKQAYRDVASAHNHLISYRSAVKSREGNVRRQLRASNYSESAVVEATRRFILALDEVRLAEASLNKATKIRDEIMAVLS